jgi:hypothetical protein
MNEISVLYLVSAIFLLIVFLSTLPTLIAREKERREKEKKNNVR